MVGTSPGSSQVLLQFFRENGWPVDGRPSGAQWGHGGCRRRRRFFFSCGRTHIQMEDSKALAFFEVSMH
jgi:hypothetical protein